MKSCGLLRWQHQFRTK